jgi:fumarate hydratase class II
VESHLTRELAICGGTSGLDGFELNAMRPIIISNFLRAARALSDVCDKFPRFSTEGTRLSHQRITDMLGCSLMIVSALSTITGYDNCPPSPTMQVPRI